MNRLARRARAAIVLAALGVGALSTATPLAAASTSFTVPFKDPNVDGWLTFCSRSNQPITTGNLSTAPFVWKAISSSPPPKGYQASTGRVTLTAYQPIQFVDPLDWSGSILTGASKFSDPSHPVVQATNVDQPLLGFVQSAPPHWDGLVEIRMLYTAIDEPQITNPYAAAVLRITGNKWTVVEGGHTPCSDGKGVSMETLELPKQDLQVSPSTSPSSSAGAAGGSSTAGGSSSGAQSKSGGGSGSHLAANESSTGGMSFGELAGIVVGAVVVLWGGIFTVGRLRRRSAS